MRNKINKVVLILLILAISIPINARIRIGNYEKTEHQDIGSTSLYEFQADGTSYYTDRDSLARSMFTDMYGIGGISETPSVYNNYTGYVVTNDYIEFLSTTNFSAFTHSGTASINFTNDKSRLTAVSSGTLYDINILNSSSVSIHKYPLQDKYGQIAGDAIGDNFGLCSTRNILNNSYRQHTSAQTALKGSSAYMYFDGSNYIDIGTAPASATGDSYEIEVSIIPEALATKDVLFLGGNDVAIPGILIRTNGTGTLTAFVSNGTTLDSTIFSGFAYEADTKYDLKIVIDQDSLLKSLYSSDVLVSSVALYATGNLTYTGTGYIANTANVFIGTIFDVVIAIDDVTTRSYSINDSDGLTIDDAIGNSDGTAISAYWTKFPANLSYNYIDMFGRDITESPDGMKNNTEGIAVYNVEAYLYNDDVSSGEAKGDFAVMTVVTNTNGFGGALTGGATGLQDCTTANTCIGMAFESGTGEKIVFLRGFITNSSWDFTTGNAVYISDSDDGTITTTAPASDNRIGVAISQREMYLNP